MAERLLLIAVIAVVPLARRPGRGLAMVTLFVSQAGVYGGGESCVHAAFAFN